MDLNINAADTPQTEGSHSSYREAKIGRTYYCVTSVFTGEKDLGYTLEKLAAQKILNGIDSKAKEILRNG